VVMSVNSTKPNEINHSSFELRILNLEEGFKKYDELLKAVGSHAKQLNEIKTKLVRIFSNY